MLSPILPHWYMPLPEPDWPGYWREWLYFRANHAARCCAILIVEDLPRVTAESYALRFEILHERAELLWEQTTETIEVIEC